MDRQPSCWQRQGARTWLAIDTVKYFVDGTPSPLAPFNPQYLKDNGLPEDYVELLLRDEQHLYESFQKAIAAGFNIHVHSMGDRAQKVVVAGLIMAQKHAPKHRFRNVIAHNMLVAPDDIKLMGENGIIANVQPLWMNENEINGPDMSYVFGKEQHKRFYPYKSLLDAGVLCANGTDFTVNLPEPLAAISDCHDPSLRGHRQRLV